MPQPHYPANVATAAMEFYAELLKQAQAQVAQAQGGAQQEWVKSLSEKAVREEVLDFALDAEDVWKRFSADQMVKLGRDVFVSVILVSHTRYKPYSRLELDGKFGEVAERIIEEFDLNDPTMKM